DLPVGVDLLRRALPDHDREYATIRQALRYERRRVVRLATVETQNNLSPRLELEKVFILQHASIPLRLGEQRVLLGDDLVVEHPPVAGHRDCAVHERTDNRLRIQPDRVASNM